MTTSLLPPSRDRRRLTAPVCRCFGASGGATKNGVLPCPDKTGIRVRNRVDEGAGSCRDAEMTSLRRQTASRTGFATCGTGLSEEIPAHPFGHLPGLSLDRHERLPVGRPALCETGPLVAPRISAPRVARDRDSCIGDQGWALGRVAVAVVVPWRPPHTGEHREATPRENLQHRRVPRQSSRWVSDLCALHETHTDRDPVGRTRVRCRPERAVARSFRGGQCAAGVAWRQRIVSSCHRFGSQGRDGTRIGELGLYVLALWRLAARPIKEGKRVSPDRRGLDEERFRMASRTGKLRAHLVADGYLRSRRGMERKMGGGFAEPERRVSTEDSQFAWDVTLASASVPIERARSG